jgi:hypothetical protein
VLVEQRADPLGLLGIAALHLAIDEILFGVMALVWES